MGKSGQSYGFNVFAFTWATAGFFHQLSFTDWRWHDPKGIVLSLAIIFVLFKPSSWKRFALFILVDWISVTIAFPDHPNHIVFSWLVNGCILASLAILAVRQRNLSDADFASAWFEAFAPWIRVMLCILYWFTFFHKLNYSYLDPDWSCGARLHLDINERFSLLPSALWAQYLSIYGTLVIEFLLPFLLLYKRTRPYAIVTGMLFHALLALHPHIGLFSFSATMIALYTTLISSSVAAKLSPESWMPGLWRRALLIPLVVIVLWTLRSWLPFLRLDEALRHLWKVGFLAYYTYAFSCLFLFIRACLRSRDADQSAQGSLGTYPLPGVFLLLMFVNGIGPYFGLRTQSSFSMFSNLHTENGVSNHLIMPAGIQFTNWQKDLVQIIDTNDPELLSARDHDYDIVYLELRRVRSGDRDDFWVEFRRNGVVERFDARKPETYESLPRLNCLAKRYFFFRPVDRDYMKVYCKH